MSQALAGFLISVVAGGLSGLLGAWLWEGTIKRRRERRSLAAALAAELDDVLVYVEQLDDVAAREQRIPPEYHAPTTVFDALVGRIGELPPTQVRRLVSLYRQLHELNRVAEHHAAGASHLAFGQMLAVLREFVPQVCDELAAISKGEEPPDHTSGFDRHRYAPANIGQLYLEALRAAGVRERDRQRSDEKP